MPHPLFKAAAVGSTPDTLEVFVIYVQFLDETDANDDPGTTGRGVFGSDKDVSYTLDPNGANIRSSRYYLDKHFEFARNYFDKVSNHRVVISDSIFPRPDALGHITPIQLDYHMKVYNPAVEDSKLKIADFEAEHAQALMTFVAETATKADAKDSADNPFKVVFSTGGLHPPNSHRYRAFMLFHAGHSRLIDGGSLGPAGANTPNDFTDFFVTKSDFQNLDSATNTFLPGGKKSPYRADSLGVVVNSGLDTVSQFMMLSEAATQDKTNWGINGILVNQLARQMGMPDLFDVVQGISQVGYFDVMDFAGYNTQNGFFPVFPSAWTRAFMGWDDPVEAPRGTGDSTEMILHAADDPGTGLRTAKVPLNEREYLLIENRQRAARDSTVTIYFSKPASSADYTFSQNASMQIPYDKLDSIFVDSQCTWSGSNCENHVNPWRPSGVITGASHYDIGLPGSGLLVWHVNEWFIESFIKDGFVNAYLGDTLRSQYKGLELVEADGIPSIGKQFTDPLGQPSFDYGTPADMLPHVFRRRKNPPMDTSWSPPDTLSVIGSYSFANTNSWNDGRTHINLQGLLPSTPLYARAIGGFTGDSVFSFRDSALTLRVSWPDDSSIVRPPGSVWPVHTERSGNFEAVNILHAADGSGPYVVSAADTGMLQTYRASGKTALAALDTVRDAAHYDSLDTILSSNTRPQNPAPVTSIVAPAGAPLGACVAGDSVFAVLTSKSLRLIHPDVDSLNDTSARSGGLAVSIPMRGVAGPMAWAHRIFAVDSQSVLRWYDLKLNVPDSVRLPSRAYHALAGLRFGSGKDSEIVVAGSHGAAVRVDPVGHQAVDLRPGWGSFKDSNEIFSVITSDFDRDSAEDVFLLGSKGSALLFHARTDSGMAFFGFPQKFPRSTRLLDTAGRGYNTEDRSSPALADLNGDGHPDILFSGTNAVFAVDWHGAWLPGWPFLPEKHQAVGLTYGSSLFPQTVIGSTPLVLSLRNNPTVLLGSPDGLIYAITAGGQTLNYSSYNASQAASTGVLMTNRADWPLSAGGLSIDSTLPPYINLTATQLDTSTDLELLAQTASGSLNAWTLRESRAVPGRNWLMPGGDAGRSFHFEAATLGAPQTPDNSEDIQEFHLFPSPVRSSTGYTATVHLKIGAAASSARVRVFNLAGHPVKEEDFANLTAGLQPFDHTLDLSRLGPDVYSVLCEVWFADGKKVSKWERVGVVK